MLKLPSVTLFTIDVARPKEAIESMQRTLRLCAFGDAVLLTDTVKFPFAKSMAQQIGVRVVHHHETDRQVRFPGIARTFFVDYELANMREPINHIGNSSHVLYMEWDSGILNPEAWDERWLKYDYIGAPWVLHNNPGWPPCDDSNNVGNAGFSLRSKAFCSLIVQAVKEHEGDPAMYSCDQWMCRSMRPWLETRGIKFAPDYVAARFSCEDRIYSGNFGFHGRATVRLNNWDAWYGVLKR